MKLSGGKYKFVQHVVSVNDVLVVGEDGEVILTSGRPISRNGVECIKLEMLIKEDSKVEVEENGKHPA
jgi:hypothetical protein